MSNSQSYLAYPDVKEAFDRAMLGKGVTVEFKDVKMAHRFLGRCNSFRILDRKENERLFEASNSLHGRSAYDSLAISRNGCVVRIKPIALDPGTLKDIEE